MRSDGSDATAGRRTRPKKRGREWPRRFSMPVMYLLSVLTIRHRETTASVSQVLAGEALGVS
jgi:hypothetical protein